MKRFLSWLKAVFNRTMDKVEDPDIMLDQARRDMQQALIQNRERAVQAITQKNRLSAMLEDAKKKSATLESQAATALKQGNREMATVFMREKMTNDAMVQQLQAGYDQAVGTVEQVKAGIKRQEEEVKKKAAEALALKAQWKNAQIQSSISKALEGLNFETEFESGSFGAARDRIANAQSEAAARQEMLGTSFSGRVMQMEEQARDMEAESELDKLEERLGMRPATAATETQTVSVGGPGAPTLDAAQDAQARSDAERQLEELEKRLNGQ
ncbi:PspA/IM30 family protein [bacterium]|nr:MAG: PspA/IM30 family protein [bacterium]